MAHVTANDGDRFDKAVREAVQHEIKAIVAEESEKASAEVQRRIAKLADRIALNVLSHYSVRDMGTELVIHVKKSVGGPT